ncbi:ABC transporter substrate-binding protein [Rhizobium sp. CC-YZS058]|uniref:ABC transporter substrate-binding protein n=1 Tax=Rhizobium sp. CC-YZS058 TaxID=3042153 RepID=UPI002B051BAD|nr:extracellular solute-binding protein [Rhizobium sp. CC-YZS058]MEA3537084.1 extracellular solute-binding protein [Rhizobium sp. CC-YZS058]
MFTISRRDLVRGVASTAAVVGISGALTSPSANAAQRITATEWGNPYLDAIKKLAAGQSDVDVNWQLYSSGAAAILPKIKASWPNSGIDLLAGWDVSWRTVSAEGWAEPVTIEKVPNLAHIPKKLLFKDNAGNIVNIPRTISSNSWLYREDQTPFVITKLDDLLDPRLKGKICFPAPTLQSNLQMISLALHFGGDERNMEPAWDYMKKLATSGNIGRIASSDQDIQSSISTGETCVTFLTGTSSVHLQRDFKLKLLTKMEPESGFKTFVYQEGWCVLKGKNSDAAFKLVNFLISPENNGAFNSAIDGIPTNEQSTASESVKSLMFSDAEMDKFVYVPDWSYIGTQASAWMSRWEQEIQPLL